eukprot:CAMPEP_0175210338 /NCGR_PEP_ID=MMETSP0093-20121207/14597_1 /TAXON_ID=311494 /ORGANISM="Alexandrium monilatum, Strain CCMP3105" /LENGTH=441 /DNA_ID=CAMNT_0016503571 /DNA_START=90 /DNA_END=1415 /DNA_ORIENTATION=+
MTEEVTMKDRDVMSAEDRDVMSETTTDASPQSPSSPQNVSRSSSEAQLDRPTTPSPRSDPSAPCDPNLWYIYGKSYDLSGFVDRHPGGRLAILSGRGRDCTALFESYHPWNDHHRRVLKAFGPAPPPPDPFYEDLKAKVRAVIPQGSKEAKMRWHCLLRLAFLWCVMVWLFFYVQTPLACAAAGVLMATVGTRLAHEGAHYQVSRKEWVNRLCLFLGYFPTGPSMAWHYRHVISHHAHTNQEHDVDVEYIWIADKLPSWLKVVLLPGLPVGAVFEIGPKQFFDMFVLRSIGGNSVDWRIGNLFSEALVWLLVHWFFGPPLMSYLAMWFTAGAIFVPCSQVAHAIVFPKVQKHASWAQTQIAESCDFAAESEFWYHLAFGLTMQVEHHLFPGVGHHLYGRMRPVVEQVCKEHGVPYVNISAKQAFYALWRRWACGELMSLAA